MRTRVIQDQPPGTTPPAVPPRRSMVSWMRRHRLVSFFSLALALSWWGWPLRAAGISEQPGFVPAGPLLAALIVITATDGRAGLRELGSRLVRWRVGARWYAAAIGLPLAVIGAVAFVDVAVFGGTVTPPGDLAWAGLALLFAVRLVNPMDGPMGEEPAWRGYAVPRLQARRSPLGSAVILGAMVSLWHWPIVVMESGSYFYLATTFVITLVYVWLFNRTGGSVLLTLLMHVTQGTFTTATLGFDAEGARRAAWLGFVAWSIVAAAVIVFDRGAWRTAPAAALPHPDRAGDRRGAPVPGPGAIRPRVPAAPGGGSSTRRPGNATPAPTGAPDRPIPE